MSLASRQKPVAPLKILGFPPEFIPSKKNSLSKKSKLFHQLKTDFLLNKFGNT